MENQKPDEEHSIEELKESSLNSDDIVKEAINVMNTPEITRKERPEEAHIRTSGESVDSSTSSETIKTNRTLKFSEMLDSEELLWKFPPL